MPVIKLNRFSHEERKQECKLVTHGTDVTLLASELS